MNNLLAKVNENGKFVKGITQWCNGLYESDVPEPFNNLGFRTLWINQYKIDEDIIYVVETETSYERTHWNKGKEAVLLELVINGAYEEGKFERIQAFDDYKEAVDFANANYPEIDLETQILAHYNELEN